MITFVTNYDPSTISNHNVVQPIVPNHGINLIGVDANRANLIHLLVTNPELPFFAITHGSNDDFFSDEDVVAFSVGDTNHFQERNVFVYACYTANNLGRLASNKNCIYWGYTGAISALVDEPASIDIFRNIFQFIINNFHRNTNEAAVTAFIAELKEMCNNAERQFDIIGGNDADFDLLTVYNCSQDIWNRLRVYIQDENLKVKHSEAEEGDLFMY